MDSLQVTDKQAADVAVAPRVQLKDIEAAIAARYDTTGEKALGLDDPESQVVMLNAATNMEIAALRNLSVCVLVMKNGFTVIGKSAPASPENFNAYLGRKFAYEDAIRQLWPLMGYALRERLYHGW